MRIGILLFTNSTQKKTAYNLRRIKDEAKVLGHTARVYRATRFLLHFGEHGSRLYYDGKPFPKCDAIITRVSVHSNIDVQTFLIKQLELNGVPVLNRYLSVSRAKNKLRTLQLLANAGVPVPHTAVIRQKADLDLAIKRLGGAPLIIKRLYGTWGNGVMIAETRRAVHSSLDVLNQDENLGIFLIQEYVKEAKGEDTRVFVVGDKVLGGMLRKAKKGEFRSNLHRGGSGKSVQISSEVADIALRSVRALGLDIAGVDVIQTKRGPVVMEVNANPSFEGFEAATGVNVAKQIVEYALQVIQSEKDSQAIVA